MLLSTNEFWVSSWKHSHLYGSVDMEMVPQHWCWTKKIHGGYMHIKRKTDNCRFQIDVNRHIDVKHHQQICKSGYKCCHLWSSCPRHTCSFSEQDQNQRSFHLKTGYEIISREHALKLFLQHGRFSDNTHCGPFLAFVVTISNYENASPT